MVSDGIKCLIGVYWILKKWVVFFCLGSELIEYFANKLSMCLEFMCQPFFAKGFLLYFLFIKNSVIFLGRGGGGYVDPLSMPPFSFAPGIL